MKSVEWPQTNKHTNTQIHTQTYRVKTEETFFTFKFCIFCLRLKRRFPKVKYTISRYPHAHTSIAYVKMSASYIILNDETFLWVAASIISCVFSSYFILMDESLQWVGLSNVFSCTYGIPWTEACSKKEL